MGIAGSIVDQNFFESYLGMRVEVVDMTEFVRRLNESIFDPVEYKQALAWVKANCKEGKDFNDPKMQRTRAQKDQDWETVVKMTMIARDLMVGNPRLAEIGLRRGSAGPQCDPRPASRANASGPTTSPTATSLKRCSIRRLTGRVFASPTLWQLRMTRSMALSCSLATCSATRAQVFADVRTYWSPQAVKRVTGHTLTGVAANGFIHLINSGAAALDGCGLQMVNGKPAMKPWWDISAEEAGACLDATRWYPAPLGYMRGGGFSSGFRTRGGMPITMSRLNLIKGQGPVLQIAEGFAVDLPEHVDRILEDRTDPAWPTTWFVPNLTGQGAFADVYSVMYNWGANHGSFSYGHIGSDLISLASILRIPVCMHNVPEERIFRPAAWNGFGVADREGADFRACASFGPLY